MWREWMGREGEVLRLPVVLSYVGIGLATYLKHSQLADLR
jgi:hypothetical protein